MKKRIMEKLIASIWQRQMVSDLVTEAGERLRVIYPGRTSNLSGCDFRDAVFILNDEAVVGDIEVHVKSSQWRHHGHHRDARYNNIALHIVWWHDSQDPTLLQNGKVIPTISLSSFFECLPDELNNQAYGDGWPLPVCKHVSYHAVDKLYQLLTEAGEERFVAKTVLFRKALNENNTGQALYRGIARALGYAQNAEPCEKLADRLPLAMLEAIEAKDSVTREALILGIAGLLPSQQWRRYSFTEDGELRRLEQRWQSLSITETMKRTDWRFFKVRPHNFPTRRLIALSYLIARYGKTGLLQGILKLLMEAPSGAAHRCLEDGLIIAGQGYWGNHFDFGIVTNRHSAILGREKVLEIVINTILPFFCAYGGITGEIKLSRRSIEIYRSYAGLRDNELTRYMKQQLQLKPEVCLSACQQQGLIHIFKSYCYRRNCSECLIAIIR